MSAWNRDPNEKPDWVGPIFFIGSMILIFVALMFEGEYNEDDD